MNERENWIIWMAHWAQRGKRDDMSTPATEEADMKPMQVPDFKVGDKVRTIAGWEGVIVKKHNPLSHRGYKVRWTNTQGHAFTHPGDESDLTPLNLMYKGA